MNQHYPSDEIHSVPGNRQFENDEITGAQMAIIVKLMAPESIKKL
jgi:hypothetical protein